MALKKTPKRKAKKGSKGLTKEVTTRFTTIMGEIIMLNKRQGGQYRNVKAFAASIHANASNFSNFDNPNNGRNVTLEMCCEICHLHKVNANWLLLGVGEKYYNAEASGKMTKMEERLKEIEQQLGLATKKK